MSFNYKRTICPAFEVGSRGGCCRFYVDIIFKDGVLTLRGRWHSQGQISSQLTDDRLIPSEGFEYSDILKIQNIWERWHLNNMRPGTPKQEDFIRVWETANEYNYDSACDALAEVGLLYDNGYKYGSSWLTEEVPTDVIRYLFTLPAVSGVSWYDFEDNSIDETEFLSVLG